MLQNASFKKDLLTCLWEVQTKIDLQFYQARYVCRV